MKAMKEINSNIEKNMKLFCLLLMAVMAWRKRNNGENNNDQWKWRKRDNGKENEEIMWKYWK